MDRESNNFTAVKLASWVFTLSAIILIVQALADALPKHAIDTAWLAHAKFHVVTGAAFQAGASLMAILIARGPFRRLEKWSWWALLIYTLSFAVHIPAALWQGSGPPVRAWYVIGLLLGLMIISLLLSWKYFQKS